MMTRKDVFNKYKLNASVNAYTSAQNDELWSILIRAVIPLLFSLLPRQRITASEKGSVAISPEREGFRNKNMCRILSYSLDFCRPVRYNGVDLGE